MEISIGQMFHFPIHNNTLYFKTRFLFSSYQGSQSPKKQFMLKTWSLTKKKLRHNLQLKTDSIKDFLTDISGKVLEIYWKKTQLSFTFPIEFLVEAWSFTKNRLRYRLPHCHGFYYIHRPPMNQPPITYSPTHRPTNHRPTDPITTDPTDKILFQRLDKWKIFILQKTNTDVSFGLLSIWWINIFIILGY